MNISLAAIGVAKQVDKDTPATAPAFYHGVSGGTMVTPEVSTSTVDVTTGLNGPAFAYRESAATAVDAETLAFQKAIGLYLYGILGEVETTGSTAPYTHVFTAGEAIPWLTFFSKLDAEYRAAHSCKLDSVEIAWDGTNPLQVTLAGAGLKTERTVAFKIPVNDERLGKYFMPLGGTYTIDVAGSSPQTYPVLSATITLSRGIEADYSCVSIEPSDINEGRLTAEVEITARVANLDDFWTIAYGAADSNTISEVPIYGSFVLGSKCGDDTLEFAGSKVAFTAEAQEANTDGGPAELSLSGELMIGEGETSQIEVTLKNDVANYKGPSGS